MESRTLAIDLFYAIGIAVGRIAGPTLFGNLVATGDRVLMSIAFFVDAGVMTIGGVEAVFCSVNTERAACGRSPPLTAADAHGS